LEKEIGVIKKERSKIKHIPGLEHGNIPIQLYLWGNEVIFRGKGQTTLYGHPIVYLSLILWEPFNLNGPPIDSVQIRRYI
jgi:hypothetical protein